jgi:hypothetical protein
MEEGRGKMEAKEKMLGLRRWSLGGERIFHSKGHPRSRPEKVKLSKKSNQS